MEYERPIYERDTESLAIKFLCGTIVMFELNLECHTNSALAQISTEKWNMILTRPFNALGVRCRLGGTFQIGAF